MKRLLLAALLLFCTSCSDPKPAAKPSLHILTALPLFWGEGAVDDIIQGRSRSQPSLQALSQKWTVHPVDVLTPQRLQAMDRLLLVQPPRLTPQELVALDAWVRQGGHVVILADPDLRWPQQRPLGDPRRAPQVSLLSPLYRHWELDLRADSPGSAPRRARIGGVMLDLPGSGHWVRQGGECRLPDPALAICQLDQGLALLVADADFLQPEEDGATAGRGNAALNWLLTHKTQPNQRTMKGELKKPS